MILSIMTIDQDIHIPFITIVRAGAHTDYGTITLLFQKDIGGLEVQASRTEWISAPIIEGTILGNAYFLLVSCHVTYTIES